MPEKNVLVHATLYANELLKVKIFQDLEKRFPDIFQDATIVTRPATSNDYYLIKKLKPQSIVVVEMKFGEMGCKKIACMGFKANLEPCEKNDSPRWIPIGKNFTLACQPMCQYDGAIDTEYRNGKCFVSNVYKKLFALFPEQVMGMKSKHNFHSGLDLVDGHLKLNEWYCQSYGLDFDGQDCVSSVGQTIGEIFLGSSVYREIFKKQTINPSTITPPSLPSYLTTPISSISRTKRSVQTPFTSNVDINAIAKDMAVELSADFGVDLTVDVIKKFLKKRVPSLIAKAADIHVKQAMLHAIIQSQAALAINFSKTLGKGLTAASSAWNFYGIVTFLMDIFDPFEYNRVLDKKTIDQIDKQLDWKFFKTEWIQEIEATPEYFWQNVLFETDQSDNYIFLAEKIHEYVTAFEELPEKPFMKLFHPEKKQKLNNFMIRWQASFHAVTILFIMCLALLFLKYFHFTCIAIFFFFVFVNSSNFLM